MQKKFITNLALVLLLNLLIKPFWILVIDTSVQNKLGAEVYGTYFALFNFSFLLNILLDVGITNYNNKNIAQNNNLLNKHASSIIILKLLLSFIYLIFSLGCGLLIGYSMDQMSLLLVLCFNQFLISFILYLRSNIAGLHLFTIDSIISVLDRVIMIGICGSLLWMNIPGVTFNINWFIFSQTFAYGITAIITMLVVIRKAKLKKLNWNPAFFLIVLKQSFPFAVLVLLMTFYNRIDTVMIERILENGAEQSGIYASAYRILDATNMIAYLFATLLLPLFAKMLSLRSEVQTLVGLSFRLLVVPAIIFSIGCFFYRHDLMEILYKEHIQESSEIFGLLMFCFIAISLTYIFGTLLTANGNLRQLNIIAGSGMIINILLNFTLVPIFMAKGSAIASLITQFLTAGVQVYMVQKIFKFKVNKPLLAGLPIFIAGTCVIGYLCTQLPVYWFISFMIMGGVSLGFAFLMRLISVKNIYHIIKYG